MTITLTGTEYVGAGSLNAGQFTLQSTVPGVTVMSVSRTDAANAVLTLAYDGTNFDTDGVFSFTVLAAAHTGTTNLQVRVGATGLAAFLPVLAVVENNNANLNALTLSAGALTPAFDTATTTYAAMVDNSVSSLTLTPTAAEAFAGITVAGTAANSGVASERVALTEGANAIAVVVTSTDGSTTQTYTVTVTRAAASGAGIAAISATNPSPLTETNLNGATATITLTNTEFESAPVAAQFTLNTGVLGVTVTSVSRTDATNVVLTLAFDGSDFDAADTLSVTVADAAHTGTGDLDSGTVSVTEVVESGGTDRMPTFGTTTITPQTYPTGTAITPLTLPEATGGDGTIIYAITETLPNGLTFDDTPATRVLSGTPTTMLSTATFTYTATDSDTTNPDTAQLPFTITIIDSMPNIVIAGGLRITADEGEVVTLNAAGSSDFEGQAITMFRWTVDAANELPVTLSALDIAAPTFTAPEERTTLNFDLTITDGSNRTATARITVQVGRSSERALQKTLAAFGGAFAAGTVGVFEDYLGNTGASANTSHFTIGGHKFELATNTPAQTLDSRVASVRKPLTRQRTLTLENDHSVVNTLSASYPQKHKSPSVSFPNDRKIGSASDHIFHRIGNPVEHDPAQPANLADTTTTMSPRDLLMKSAFHFNLNDDATATSGWSLWARATTTNFNGKPEDDFDLDGDVTSAYLGMDYQTPTGTRLGLAISETSGDVDYDDATDEAQGDLDADLTSILPYIQWQPNDTTTAWAMLGYGEGDAELSTDGEAETTEVDIDMQMIALGISGDLTTYKRSEWSWKASAFAVELESEADEATDLPAVDANAQRLRAAIQGRVPGEASATGTQFTPNWELGLRWDDGDAEQGGGADVGLGFNYTNPVNGLSVQGKTSFLVAHEAEDYEEWEASLQARLDSGVQGRGITFTLEPGWTEDGRTQKMGMDFSNALGKWTKRGLRLELTGERTEQDDDNIGHNIRLTGSLRF